MLAFYIFDLCRDIIKGNSTEFESEHFVLASAYQNIEKSYEDIKFILSPSLSKMNDLTGKFEPLVYDKYAKQFIEIGFSSVIKDYTDEDSIVNYDYHF